MKEALPKSNLTMCEGSSDVRFLRASDSGISPCSGPDGLPIDPSGRAHALANRGVAPERAKAMPTSATYGPLFETSYAQSDLPLFSESKSPAPQLSEKLGEALKSRMSRFGSMEYGQTWKLRVTPSGLRLWAHTVAGHPTSGKGVTGSRMLGHPTPSSEGSAGEISEDLVRVGRKFHNRKTGRILQTNLATETLMLCGHPTPNCPTGGPNSNRENRGAGGADLEEIANLAGHPTPDTHPDCPNTGTHRENGRIAKRLTQQGLGPVSQLAGHPTCSARDWKDTPGMAQTGINPDGALRTRLDMLPRVSALAGHATPRVTTNSGIGNPERACDGKSRLEDQCHGANTESTDTSTAKTAGYRLNPGFSLWLMIGIPGIVDAWASCGVLAMESCRRLRRSS